MIGDSRHEDLQLFLSELQTLHSSSVLLFKNFIYIDIWYLFNYFSGADSVTYLSVEGLEEAVSKGIVDKEEKNISHCKACLTGKYPVELVWWLNIPNHKETWAHF